MAHVSSVFTITRVAKMLGEDEDWLHELSDVMMPEHGALWVYGTDDEPILAFTREGIDNLRHLVDQHHQTAETAPSTKKNTTPPRP